MFLIECQIFHSKASEHRIPLYSRRACGEWPGGQCSQTPSTQFTRDSKDAARTIGLKQNQKIKSDSALFVFNNDVNTFLLTIISV